MSIATIRNLYFSILIQNPEIIIQNSGKADPEKIRQKKPAGQFPDFEKFENQYQNQKPQNYNVQKRVKRIPQSEKKNRPQAVEKKLREKEYHRGFAGPNQIQGDAHKRVKQNPGRRKNPGRRLKPRLLKRRVPDGGNRRAGEKRASNPDCFANCDRKNQFQKISHRFILSACRIVCEVRFWPDLKFFSGLRADFCRRG
jgi:hypothetical protein